MILSKTKLLIVGITALVVMGAFWYSTALGTLLALGAAGYAGYTYFKPTPDA